MQGFKNFILRGNVVELAVGVVIGAAFDDLVSSFVDSFLTPFIAMFGGQESVESLAFTLGGTTFTYGAFLSALLSFLIIAAVIYFLVVLPMNRLVTAVKSDESPDPTTRKCPYCFTSIPIKATRCPNCTSDVKKKGE